MGAGGAGAPVGEGDGGCPRQTQPRPRWRALLSSPGPIPTCLCASESWLGGARCPGDPLRNPWGPSGGQEGARLAPVLGLEQAPWEPLHSSVSSCRPVSRTSGDRTRPNAFSRGKNGRAGEGCAPCLPGGISPSFRGHRPDLGARSKSLPRGAQAGPPRHGRPPGVTHSAWSQGMGTTFELASRCGL